MPDRSFTVEMVRGVPVVAAPDEVDVTNAGRLRAALMKAAAHGNGTLVIDMTRTRFCDCASLHPVLAAHKQAQARGGQVLVASSAAAVVRVFTITGIDRVIPTFSSLDDALAHTRGDGDRPAAASESATRPGGGARASLPGGRIDVRRRQFADLLPGDAHLDAVVESGHRAERDRDVLVRQHMPFDDQHVGHCAAAGVDAQTADVPDVAIGGVHPAAMLRHLTGRDDVDRLLFRDPRNRAARHGRPARAAPAGGQQLNRNLVAERELRQRLLRGVKALELGFGAAEPELAGCRVNKVQRHQPGKADPALRLDHEMGHRAGERVENDRLHLAAVPVGAHGRTAEHKRDHHRTLPCQAP